MRINKIIVSGLFGNLNHEIPLHESGVTMIHGPNGCGKTTILNLLKSIFDYEFDSLLAIKFKTFEIIWSESQSLMVEKYQNAPPSYTYHRGGKVISKDDEQNGVKQVYDGFVQPICLLKVSDLGGCMVENIREYSDEIKKCINNAGLIESEDNLSSAEKNRQALELKIDTFQRIIAPKLRNKKFSINGCKGLVFGVPDQISSLDPSLLSSGE